MPPRTPARPPVSADMRQPEAPVVSSADRETFEEVRRRLHLVSEFTAEAADRLESLLLPAAAGASGAERDRAAPDLGRNARLRPPEPTRGARNADAKTPVAGGLPAFPTPRPGRSGGRKAIVARGWFAIR